MTPERLKEIKTIQHQIVTGEMSVMDFREKGGKALYDCLSLLSEQEAENARLINKYKHTHKAHYENGKLTDQCDICGFDLRNKLHTTL